jgi:hypothetical protein
MWFRGVIAGVMFACLFAAKSVAQDRALIISIDAYAQSTLSGLPPGLANNNSAAIKKLLTEKLGYKPEHIKILHNKQATKSAIMGAISGWLGPESGEDGSLTQLKGLDESGVLNKQPKGKKKRVKKRRKKRKKRLKSYRSYLYFAGFGLLPSDGGMEYLDQTIVPYDATSSTAEGQKIFSGVISGDELAGAMAKFVRRRVTLVFDARNIGTTASLPNPRPIQEKVTLWSAASQGQTALVAGSQANPIGLFTSAYVKAIAGAEADANANGIISNAEVLHFVSDVSSAYCRAYRERCAAGVKPLLRPARAYGRSAWINRSKVYRGKERRLTLTRLADFLGEPAKSGVQIRQDPPSPLKVGAGNIRYEVLSASAGHLVLLNLTDRGELFQLYPNQYAGQDKKGFAGRLEANTALRVPEDSYGISFSATVPAKGHIIAVQAPGAVRFYASVNARSISSVSPKEAIGVYLAELAAALSNSTRLENLSATSGPVRWSVVTLPYEILP